MKTIISLIFSAFLLSSAVLGQQKQSDYYKEQQAKCSAEVDKLNRDLADLQARKQKAMKEFRDGVYCSICERTPTEIWDEEKEAFEQHLESVNGVAKRPTQAQINEKEKKFTDQFTSLGKKRADKISECNDLSNRYQTALADEARKAAEEKAEREKKRRDSLENIRLEKIEKEKRRQDSLAHVKAEKERRDQEIRDSLEAVHAEKVRRAQAYLDSLEAANKAAELARREELREVTQDYSNSLHQARDEFTARADQGRNDVDNSLDRVEDATSNRSWTGIYRSAEELGASVFSNEWVEKRKTTFLNNCNRIKEAVVSATNRFKELPITEFMGKTKEFLQELTSEAVKDALTSQIPERIVKSYDNFQQKKERMDFITTNGKSVGENLNKALDRFDDENKEPDPYKYTTMRPVPMDGDEGDVMDKSIRNYDDWLNQENPVYGEEYKTLEWFKEQWKKFMNNK